MSNATGTLAPVETRASPVRAFVRGLLRHFPRCGAGKLFKHWMHIIDHCPRCGLIFEAEEGYWVGAMIWNLVVTELLFVVLVGIGVALTWPELGGLAARRHRRGVNGLVPIIFIPSPRRSGWRPIWCFCIRTVWHGDAPWTAEPR